MKKHGDTEAQRGKGEVIQLVNRINFYNNSTRIGTDFIQQSVLDFFVTDQ